MLDNHIDTRVAEKYEFLTHTLYIKKIGNFISAFVTINKDVYFEMELSSRHFSYGTSLHDRNTESLSKMFTLFGIEPNPDFIFKGKPIENERYLIYRYIKSIFLQPNGNLFMFANDQEFESFCGKNNLEYINQEWFKRIYIEDSYDKAISYFIQNSLSFQELYFPSNQNNEVFKPTLHDINQLHAKYTFKEDFYQIFDILRANKISKFYHFTDKKNVESIKKNGLLSATEVLVTGLRPKYASSVTSREIDKEMGLSDYIRLSFVKSHPMMFTSMTAYGLHPVVLEINPLIALMPNVFFSDRNTLKVGANIGPGADDLSRVDFGIVKSNVAYYNLPDVKSKNAYQAEVLVKQRIGPEFITNINEL